MGPSGLSIFIYVPAIKPVRSPETLAQTAFVGAAVLAVTHILRTLSVVL